MAPQRAPHLGQSPWDVDLSVNWRYLSAVKLDLNSSQPALNAGSYDAYDAVIPSYSYLDVSATWRLCEELHVSRRREQYPR